MQRNPLFASVTGCLVLPLLMGVPGGPRSPGNRCVMITPPNWVRNNTISYVIIAASDTIEPAIAWDPPPGEWRQARMVNGQRVSVLRAGGASESVFPPDAARQALLVSWDLINCTERIPAHGARVLSPNAAAFLEVTPSRYSPSQLAVLEIDMLAGVYVPEVEQRQHGRSWRRLWRHVKVLTVNEYRSLYVAMPPDSVWKRDPDHATALLESWATSHPHLAKRDPARTMLLHARWLRYQRNHPEPAQN